MEINETAKKVDLQEQTVQLVKGEFTPSQASDIVMCLINQKINYHKLQGMQLWERNHSYDEMPVNNRIKELEEQRTAAAAFIANARAEDKHLHIDGIIEMTITDE
ncbi:MAG: hypothetical protein ACOH2A_11395 [Sphingobacteriaceae bacterium]